MPRPRIVAITFGDKVFEKSVKRHGAELAATGVFDEVRMFGPQDLGDEFLKRHGEFLRESKRGYGYWLWKPFIILRALKELNDGDILVYGDAGNTVTGSPAAFREMVWDVVQSEEGVLASQCNRIGVYCKRDVYGRMGVNGDQYRFFPIAEAGRLILRRSPRTLGLVSAWYEGCLDYRNIDDSPSEAPEYPEYEEHRHDQAVFSIVFNRFGGELVDFSGVWDAKRIRDADMPADYEKLTSVETGVGAGGTASAAAVVPDPTT